MKLIETNMQITVAIIIFIISSACVYVSSDEGTCGKETCSTSLDGDSETTDDLKYTSEGQHTDTHSSAPSQTDDDASVDSESIPEDLLQDLEDSGIDIQDFTEALLEEMVDQTAETLDGIGLSKPEMEKAILQILDDTADELKKSNLEAVEEDSIEDSKPITDDMKLVDEGSTADEKQSNILDTEKSVELDEGKLTNTDLQEYEFPEIKRIDPGNVGDVVDIHIQDGKVHKRITRAQHPPVFEIPDFLSPEECEHIKTAAINNGLDVSNLFGAEINDELNKGRNLSDISRISEQTWLTETSMGKDFWGVLQERVSRLIQLPLGLVQRSESMQVVSYVPGGHYHAHLDTVDNAELPCCFVTRCGEKEFTAQWSECCRICRFITVLYYLSDVEAGGETAFPLADAADDVVTEKMTDVRNQNWYNLSHYCHNSSLVVSPKRGTAIMWYNHFVDPETGYLGAVDNRSHHGGCDLIKGSKWIANNWISATPYKDRFSTSVFYSGP